MNSHILSQEYLESVMSDNSDSLLFARIAHVLLYQKKISEATEIAENGVHANPEYIAGRYVLALCYAAMNQDDAACTQLQKMLYRVPMHQRALALYATLLRRCGDTQSASGVAELLWQIDPQGPLTTKNGERCYMGDNIYEILHLDSLSENPHKDAGVVELKVDEHIENLEDAEKTISEENEENTDVNLDDLFDADESLELDFRFTEDEEDSDTDLEALLGDLTLEDNEDKMSQGIVEEFEDGVRSVSTDVSDVADTDVLLDQEEELVDCVSDIGFSEKSISSSDPDEQTLHFSHNVDVAKTSVEETVDIIEIEDLTDTFSSALVVESDEDSEALFDTDEHTHHISPEVLSVAILDEDVSCVPDEIGDVLDDVSVAFETFTDALSIPDIVREENDAERDSRSDFMAMYSDEEDESTMHIVMQEHVEETVSQTSEMYDGDSHEDVDEFSDFKAHLTDAFSELNLTETEVLQDTEKGTTQEVSLHEIGTILDQIAEPEEEVKEQAYGFTSVGWDPLAETADYSLEKIRDIITQPSEENLMESLGDGTAEFSLEEMRNFIAGSDEEQNQEAILPVEKSLEGLKSIPEEKPSETPAMFDTMSDIDDFRTLEIPLETINEMLRSESDSGVAFDEGEQTLSFENEKIRVADILEENQAPFVEGESDDLLNLSLDNVPDVFVGDTVSVQGGGNFTDLENLSQVNTKVSIAPLLPLTDAECLAEPLSEKDAFTHMLASESGGESLPDHVLTPTFAQIYLDQDQLSLARQIFERLLERSPEHDEYVQKIKEIDMRLAHRDSVMSEENASFENPDVALKSDKAS